MAVRARSLAIPLLAAAVALAPACAANPGGVVGDDDTPGPDGGGGGCPAPCPDGGGGGGGPDGGGGGGGPDGGTPSTCTGGAAAGQPFGAHGVPNAAGTILPDHHSQAELDDAVRAAYDAWKGAYLVRGCGAGRAYVATGMPSSQTVSEAHGYGMILVAYMAGHDPEAHELFDDLYRYFIDHQVGQPLGLMSWSQDSSCDNNQGDDSATDGDLDIAYALLLADKQWGSGGGIDYAGEAKRVLGAIAGGEIDGSGGWVLLGNWPSPGSQFYDATRSSDFMPGHLRSFAAATGDGEWTTLADRTYQTFTKVVAGSAGGTGLVPDFILDPDGNPHPPGGQFLEHASDGRYAYNACRVPWRVGVDAVVNGDPRARGFAAKLSTWLRGQTGGDAGAIRAGYELSGAPAPSSGYTSMAFVPPFGVAAMVDAANQDFLNSIWDTSAGADPQGYYEDTIKVLAMVVMSGNWWSPEAAPCP